MLHIPGTSDRHKLFLTAVPVVITARMPVGIITPHYRARCPFRPLLFFWVQFGKFASKMQYVFQFELVALAGRAHQFYAFEKTKTAQVPCQGTSDDRHLNSRLMVRQHHASIREARMSCHPEQPIKERRTSEH